MKTTNMAAIRMIAVAACATVLALSLAGCTVERGSSSEGDRGITVSASYETKVVPDRARVSFSVVTEEKDAETCRDKNAKSVNDVVGALQALGVEEKSIQTSYSSLSPRYGSRVTTTDDKTAKADGEAYDEWVITGYEMTTELTVSDLEIDNVGTVVQACVSAGANRSNGIEFYVSDYDAAYNTALTEAIAIAKSKAESIAQSTDVHLGKAVSVTEGYQDTSARYVASTNAVDEMDADKAEGVAAKTMPGQVDISAHVTVTYAIS